VISWFQALGFEWVSLCRYCEALAEYDEFCALTKRRYVRPNFAEVRHIINIAQARAGYTHARGACITFHHVIVVRLNTVQPVWCSM
jgi:hypothetical protein